MESCYTAIYYVLACTRRCILARQCMYAYCIPAPQFNQVPYLIVLTLRTTAVDVYYYLRFKNNCQPHK